MTPIETPVGLEPQTHEITRRARKARACEVMFSAPAAAVVLLALLGLHERPDGYAFTPTTVIAAIVILASFTAVGWLAAGAIQQGRLDTILALEHGLSPEERENVRADIRDATPSADPVLRYVEAHTASRMLRLHTHDGGLVVLLTLVSATELLTTWPHLFDIAVVVSACAVLAGVLMRCRALLRPARRFLRVEKFTPHPDSCVEFESPADRVRREVLAGLLAGENGRDITAISGHEMLIAWQKAVDGDTLTR